MNELQRNIIQLIQSGLTGQPVKLPVDFDWSAAIEVGLKQQVIPLLYEGVLHSKLSPPANLMQTMEQEVYQNLLISQKQLYVLSCIYASFDQNGITYMPLKGALLKHLYPKPEMRTMSDADILIKLEQYEKIRPLMVDLGFWESTESQHERKWEKEGALHLELHKCLISPDNRDYYPYYADAWRLAIPCGGTRYAMKDEDQLVYLFTHFAKHYRDAGIGIRQLVDLWVYRQNKPQLDEAYIRCQLDQMRLAAFYDNVLNTLDVWFAAGTPDTATEQITEVVFNSGVFGTHDAKVLSVAYKTSKTGKKGQSARLKVLLGAAFLPYKNMTIKYPVLKKIPILLPIMWGVRLIDGVLFKRNRIKTQVDAFELATAQHIQAYGQALQMVGLDFDFKE